MIFKFLRKYRIFLTFGLIKQERIFMKWFIQITHFFLFLFGVIEVSAQGKLREVERVPLDSITQVSRIAFGSCNLPGLPQEMWYNVMQHKPDVWVWLGDNIYGDTRTMEKMIRKYNRQLSKPSYVHFLKKVPVIGIWDDHDYGENNTDKNYPMKEQTQQLFLDFIGEPLNSERRTRKGIYTSHTFGEPGKKVKFLLLDIRYHRDKPGVNADMLGQEQWAWLENELKHSDAQIHIVATGTQMLSDKKMTERWMAYPAAVKRFFSLIKNNPVPGLFVLSGDIHCGEMMMYSSTDIPYTLYEFTSSGLTHAHWAPGIRSNTYKIRNPSCTRNYGLITIQWNEPVSIKVELRDIQDFVLQETTIYLDDLKSTQP